MTLSDTSKAMEGWFLFLAYDVISILGPGNVHFDHGQDIYFIKPAKEYPTQGDKGKNAERRFVTISLA